MGLEVRDVPDPQLNNFVQLFGLRYHHYTICSDQLFRIDDDCLVRKSKTPRVMFSLLNPSFFTVTQDLEPLYKSCVENLVKELAMQKLAEPQVVEKKD